MKIAIYISLYFLLIAPFQAMSQTVNGTQQTAETPFSSDPKLHLKNTIELFPNPVEDYLQIKILNSELKDVQFEMHSIIGNAVQIETEDLGKDSYRIPVESFASGYYFLVIKDDITRFSKAVKFLKKD